MRLRSGYRFTVLNFPRGEHPGLSTHKRFEELARTHASVRAAALI